MIKIIKNIVPKHQHYYVAVSMGLDSVAALLWLINKKYKVTAVHFNHNLRFQNQLMENKFIELCKDFNLNYVLGKGNNLSTEKECRNARLNFYNDYANGNIITAHHLNDCVESYLLNCFRGKPNHDPFELVSNFPKFNILHPFLLTRKKDFQQYVERNDYAKYIITDETNFIIKGSRRNWIRNTIIPEMKNQKLSLEKFVKRKILEKITKNQNIN